MFQGTHIDVQSRALIYKLCKRIQKIDMNLKLFTSISDEQSSFGIRCKYMDKFLEVLASNQLPVWIASV